MEDKRFDKYFQETLGKFSVEYDPDSWDSLSEKLDREEKISSDEEFDGEVRNSIEHYSESYNPHTWPILLKKIEENEYYRARLIGTKVAESVILLLLIFTIGRMAEPASSPTEQRSVAEAGEIISDPGTDAAMAQVPVPDKKEDISDASAVNSATAAVQTGSGSNNANAGNPPATIRRNGSAGRDIQGALPVSTPARTLGPIARVPFLQPPSLAGPGAPAIAANVLLPALANPNLVGLIGMSSIHSIPQTSALWLNKIRQKNHKRIYLSAFAGTDINYIETPFDNLLYTEGYRQTRAGYGGGLTLQYGGKTVYIETGFAYSAKNYSPEKFVELLPFDDSEFYKGESLEGIRFNILSIPFNVLYKFKNKGKWQMYATAGSSLNLSLVSSYRKEQQILSDSDPLPPKYLITSSRVAQLDKKDYEGGLFEGGEFKDNYYITLNSGVGVERILTQDWALFTQASYQFNFFNTGLGPNQDRISTFSLYLGTRYRID